MLKELGPGFRLTLVMTVLAGLLYPAIMTPISQLLFPNQANGSLITVNGKVVGSSLIGQAFSKSGYFHSRPSSAGSGYDAAASSGSNLGPTSQKLLDRVKGAVEEFHKDNPEFSGNIPSDIVSASASGLDPHISPAAAEAQVSRVAKVRGIPAGQVRRVVAEHTAGPDLGFLGEPRVNVLTLNLALDALAPKGTAEN